MNSGSYVATPTLVYAWFQTKDEFDALALKEAVHEWQPSETITIIKRDGQQWERQCRSKRIEADGVTVVFQFFDERPVAA